MDALQQLVAGLPDTAKDIRLNLGTVLQQSVLSPALRFGVALAVALAARSPAITTAADAQAAAAVALSCNQPTAA